MLSQSQTAGRLALALAAGAGLHSKGAANESGSELVPGNYIYNYPRASTR